MIRRRPRTASSSGWPRAASRVPRALAAAFLLLLAGAGGEFLPVARAAETLAPEIRVTARELAPGEPLRVVALSAEPLDELTASLLERTIPLVRAGSDDEGRERWVGFGMIGLDDPSGPALLTLGGRARSGTLVAGAHALVVVEKDFPREELEVAPRYVEPPVAVRERLADERRRLDALYARRSSFPPPSEPFVRPVPGEPTGIFGARRVFNGKPRAPHSGIDLRAPTGTPVLAAGPGEVVLAEDLYFSGLTVLVDHGGGLFTIYAHLSKLEVEPGVWIEPGERVGLAGATGRVTGPHLHWGGKIGKEIFNPMALLDPRLFE